jgi:hypothetical protein
MRARSHNSRIILADRPFQGDLGASLYVGTPEAIDIRYRRLKVMSPRSRFWPITTTETIDPGAASVPKSQRVAFVTDPTAELTYELPDTLIGVPVACQVRTFWNDYENESIYRPVITGSDDDGDQTGEIYGTANILDPIKLDGGGISVSFQYYPSVLGIQPTGFALVQTSGPGSLPDALTGTDTSSGFSTISIPGLTNATAYGWRLEARNGAAVTDLGNVAFTADAVGPAGTTTLTVIPE